MTSIRFFKGRSHLYDIAPEDPATIAGRGWARPKSAKIPRTMRRKCRCCIRQTVNRGQVCTRYLDLGRTA